MNGGENNICTFSIKTGVFACPVEKGKYMETIVLDKMHYFLILEVYLTNTFFRTREFPTFLGLL